MRRCQRSNAHELVGLSAAKVALGVIHHSRPSMLRLLCTSAKDKVDRRESCAGKDKVDRSGARDKS
jgi:hypothetical protein